MGASLSGVLRLWMKDSSFFLFVHSSLADPFFESYLAIIKGFSHLEKAKNLEGVS
jgi:hypothetical protein